MFTKPAGVWDWTVISAPGPIAGGHLRGPHRESTMAPALLLLLTKGPLQWGFPGAVVKNPPTNAGDAGDAGDVGLIPESGRSSGVGNSIIVLQYSCLGNPMDRGAWWATWGLKESDMTEQLSTAPTDPHG